MAKANKLYTGHNSIGVAIEVSESISGQWYWREYGYNGFGNGWSKWQSMDEIPTLTNRILNPMAADYPQAPEYIELDEPVLEWGFTNLKPTKPGRIRLPA